MFTGVLITHLDWVPGQEHKPPLQCRESSGEIQIRQVRSNTKWKETCLQNHDYNLAMSCNFLQNISLLPFLILIIHHRNGFVDMVFQVLDWGGWLNFQNCFNFEIFALAIGIMLDNTKVIVSVPPSTHSSCACHTELSADLTGLSWKRFTL